MSVLAEIQAERHRQVEREGFDLIHDDAHEKGELARHAAALALCAAQEAISAAPGIAPDELERDGCTVGLAAGAVTPWPDWLRKSHHKPARQLLVQAAALLVAEVERLDRKAPGGMVRL